MLLKMIMKYLISYGIGRNKYQSFHGNNTQCPISQLVWCAMISQLRGPYSKVRPTEFKSCLN